MLAFVGVLVILCGLKWAVYLFVCIRLQEVMCTSVCVLICKYLFMGRDVVFLVYECTWDSFLALMKSLMYLLILVCERFCVRFILLVCVFA